MKNNLKLWKNNILLFFILIVLQLLISKVEGFRIFVWEYYYQPISKVALQIFSVFQFPFGEVYYLFLILGFFWIIITTFTGKNKVKIKKRWNRALSILLLNAILISVQWTPMYFMPSQYQKQHAIVSNESSMSKEEWLLMAEYFIERIDVYYLNQVNDYSYHEIIKIAEEIFLIQQDQAKDWSLKTSYFTPILKKLGVSGYYNPFTFEAYIDASIPKTLIPFVALHELSHQAGVAEEGVANFMAYEYGIKSGQSLFSSASYFQALLYVNHYLKKYYPEDFDLLMIKMPKNVLRAYEEYVAYLTHHQSIIGTWSSWFLDSFLKIQGQEEGVQSYAQFIQWIYNHLPKEHKTFEQTI